ncbi:MAG: flagellar protein FlaG [Pararobbsia sp.]
MDVSASNRAGETPDTTASQTTAAHTARHHHARPSHDVSVSNEGAALSAQAQAAAAGGPAQVNFPADSAPPVSAAYEAIAQINAAMKQFSTSLEFTFDPATFTHVVKVIDSETGKTVSQMPTEDAIKAAQSLEMKGLLIGQKA